MGKPVDYVKLSISVFVISFLFFYAIQLVAAALIFFGGGKEHFLDDMITWTHDAVQGVGRGFQDATKVVGDGIVAGTNLFLSIPDETARIATKACTGLPAGPTRAACQISALAGVCGLARGNQPLAHIGLLRGGGTFQVCSKAVSEAQHHGVLTFNAAKRVWKG